MPGVQMVMEKNMSERRRAGWMSNWGSALFYVTLVLVLLFFWWLLIYSGGVSPDHG